MFTFADVIQCLHANVICMQIVSVFRNYFLAGAIICSHDRQVDTIAWKTKVSLGDLPNIYASFDK